jgi:predicted metal-dependent hydrolase
MLEKELADLLPSHVPVYFVRVTEQDSYYDSCHEDKFIFTDKFEELEFIKRKYVVLHELAHFNTSEDHGDAFYQEMERLIEQHGMDWSIAREVEQVYPMRWKDRI